MKRAAFAVLLLAATAHAAGKAKLPKLTSAFTPLPPNKACTAAEDKDKQHCPGKAEYTVTIGKSDGGSYIRVQKGELVVDLPDGKLGKQLEWRMADGVPFAVIASVTDGDGTRLVVRGLEGFGAIGGQVNAKDKGAAKKAQQLADTGFANAKSLPDKKP